MVKGTARRVVVVKSPDPRLFEEAIFIVRDDAKSRGVTGEELLREAQRTADQYIRAHRGERPRLWKRLPPWCFGLLGAGTTALIWFFTALLG